MQLWPRAGNRGAPWPFAFPSRGSQARWQEKADPMVEPSLVSRLVARIRQSHALEHATMHVLGRSQPPPRLVGRSDWDGFSLYGQVKTQAVRLAAAEALDRLQANEAHLAVHPRCGGNLATAFLLAAGAICLAHAGPRRPPLKRLTSALVAAVAALIAARPLGLALQRHVTTTSNLEGVRIRATRRELRGPLVVHRVSLTCDAEAEEHVLRPSR